MAEIYKSKNGKIRLWKGTDKKTGSTNIGIRFDRMISEGEIANIYQLVQSYLIGRYNG